MKNTKQQRGPAGMPWLPGGPIDWAAWTAEAIKPRGMKGRKMSPEVCAKFSAAQKKRFAHQRAQLAEALRLQREAQVANPAPAIYDPLVNVNNETRVFGTMEPGSWYSTLDMAQVSSVKYQSCKALAVKWWRAAMLKRQQNPDWRPPERPGAPQAPKWLYALTAVGEQRHRLAKAIL